MPSAQTCLYLPPSSVSAWSHNGADCKRTMWSSIWTLRSVNQAACFASEGRESQTSDHTVMTVGISWEGSIVVPMGREATFSCMQYTTPEIHSLTRLWIHRFHFMGVLWCPALWLFECPSDTPKIWLGTSKLSDILQKWGQFWPMPNNKLAVILKGKFLKNAIPVWLYWKIEI